MGEVVEFGHWPALDKLLRDAESHLPGFTADTRAQSHLIHALGRPDMGYWMLPPDARSQVVSRLTNLVPRVAACPNPREMIERLFYLYATDAPFENIARALKVVDYQPRDLTFDEHIYPTHGILGAFNYWCRESDVPLGYFFWAGVAMIGAACRYNWFIDRGTDTMRMNHYIILAGDKATGKSTAMDAALEVLRHLNAQVWGWRPGDNLPNLSKEHPFHVRLLPEDTNQETLVRCLRPGEALSKLWIPDAPSNPQLPATLPIESTGMLALDELATFLGRDTWNIAKRVPFLTRIHADKRYVYHTQSGGNILLEECAVSMLACCTPEWLKDAITPLIFSGGFMDRTLVIHREPLPLPLFPTARPRDPLAAADIARMLVPFTRRWRREELIASPSAIRWFEDWFHRQDHTPDLPHEPSLKRRANHLWKLAGILTLSDGRAPHIMDDHFELADRVFDFEWTRFRKLLGVLEEPPESELMDVIEAWLERRGAIQGTSVFAKHRDLYAMCANRRGLSPPTQRAKPLLDTLVETERVVREPVQRRGQTTYQYQLGVDRAEDRKRRRGGQPTHRRQQIPELPAEEEPEEGVR